MDHTFIILKLFYAAGYLKVLHTKIVVTTSSTQPPLLARNTVISYKTAVHLYQFEVQK